MTQLPADLSCCASRRHLLRAAGVATLATAGAGALSACGPGGGDGAGASVAEDGTIRVPADDTDVGGATYYSDPKVVVTQPTAGDFRAFDATCPHQGCSTSVFTDGQIVCPCHGSAFDPTTGDVRRGPAETGLAALQVSLDGGDVLIRG